MWPGAQDVAASGVLLAHTSLVPAGVGVVAALVRVAPPVGALAGQPGPGGDLRVHELRARAAAGQLPTVQEPTQPQAGGAQDTGRPDDGGSSVTGPWQVAAVCTAASAVVHAVAAPHHADEHLVLGVFFSLSAVAQFAWATGALLSPHRRLLWHGVWLHLTLVVLWVVSRTVGLPVLVGGREAVGAWDLAAKLWELGAIACCVTLLRPSGATAAVWLRHPGLVWATLSLSVAVLVTLGLVGAPS